jgi:hypothetical protein
MLCISGAIILYRAISSSVTRPSISTPPGGLVVPSAVNEEVQVPAIEKTDEIGFELPKSLNTLTNHELRLTAYNLKSYVDDLTHKYFVQIGALQIENVTGNKKASRVAILDQTLNREFRATYAGDILTLQEEILSRLKVNNQTPKIVPIHLPNGLLNVTDINQTGVILTLLSNQLQ